MVGFSTRKHHSDRAIILFTLVLMLVGLVVIYAVGPARALSQNAALGYEAYGENEYFIHQLVSVVAALTVFIVAAKLPFEKVQKYAKWVMAAGLVACLLLAVLALIGSSLAMCANGACRWISLGGLGTLQPAEILKLGMVLYLSGLISERKREGELEKLEFWLPYIIVVAVSLFFVVFLQKDLGSGIAVGAIAIAMLFASGVSLRQFGIFVVVAGVAGVLSIVVSPHRMERVMTFQGDGNDYHISNALMAIGSGGITGVGIGNSVEATGYLPESINDSVFAVMGETFGFVGLVAVLGCFLGLALRLLHLANFADAEEHALIATGVFAWVVVQVAINVMAMIGMIPLTGITLPLLSYGGTSMVFIAAGLGICLQLSCYTRREERHESASSRRGLRGAHYASRRGGA